MNVKKIRMNLVGTVQYVGQRDIKYTEVSKTLQDFLLSMFITGNDKANQPKR